MRLAVRWITLCLLLTGCTGTDKTMQPALDLRAQLLASGGCGFAADVTADFGQTVYEFSARCDWSAQRTRITITAPEEIAGIAATISDDGATLEYDDVLLELGALAGGNLAPVAAPAIVCACWAGEYVSAAGRAEGGTLVTYLRGYDEKELTVTTMLSADGTPVSGEIEYGGETVVTMTITDFSCLS